MKIIGKRQRSEEGPGAFIVEMSNDEWEATRAFFGPLPATMTTEAVYAWENAKSSIVIAAKALGLALQEKGPAQ